MRINGRWSIRRSEEMGKTCDWKIARVYRWKQKTKKKDKNKCDTKGDEKANALAKMESCLGSTSRAHSEMQHEKENVKHIMKCAFLFHEHGGDFNDMQQLEEQLQGTNNFQINKDPKWQHDAVRQQEDPRVCATNVEK